MRALRDVAEQGGIVNSGESGHGEKFVVDGWLSAHTEESRPASVMFGSFAFHMATLLP